MITAAEEAALLELAKKLNSEVARIIGRVGGSRRNPRKGFGTGDNARRAALVRWAKVRGK